VLTPALRDHLQEELPDKVFSPLLLPYLEGLKGVSRDKTFEEAENIVKESEDAEKEDPRYNRAMKVVETLAQ
jgi:hypothetical protein